MSDDLFVAPGIVVPARDLSWTAARSSGPGGQNVNKVATKIELRFDLTRTEALSASVKARLRAAQRPRLDADGRLMVVSQATRSQTGNLEDARQRLAQMIRAALTPPKKRRPTRPTRASKERRLDSKRRQSEKKQARGRQRHD